MSGLVNGGNIMKTIGDEVCYGANTAITDSPVSSLEERRQVLNGVKSAIEKAASSLGITVQNIDHKRLRVCLPDVRRGFILTINLNGPPTEEQQRAVKEVLARISRRRKNS
jgi:hypothetical protein